MFFGIIVLIIFHLIKEFRFSGKFTPIKEREKLLEEKAHRFDTVCVKSFGDDLDDEKLEDLFKKYGKITSAKVMLDEMGKSKGFGFVCFEEPENAEKAIEDLNGKELNGQKLCIKLARIKSERTVVNSIQGAYLYVKNLDDSLDDEKLRKEFSPYGLIITAKVMTDRNGQPLGFGFVYFCNQEEATKAMTEMNGRIVGSKPLHVSLAQQKEERKAHLVSECMKHVPDKQMQIQFPGKLSSHKEEEKHLKVKASRVTKIYVKNLADDFNNEKLWDLFKKYGRITSAKVVADEMGKSKGFGFVFFAKPENAHKAIEGLNGKELNGKILCVQLSCKTSERNAVECNQGVNLYVKNLDDSFNDEKLRKEFSSYGLILSAKVMTDGSGLSKGFGFVCFSSPQEATKAVTEMNGRIVGSRSLYVSMAQRKKERKAHFASKCMQHVPDQQMQLGQMFNPGRAGYLLPSVRPAGMSSFPPMAQMRAFPGWPTQPQIRPNGPSAAAAFQAMQSAPFALVANRPTVAPLKNPVMSIDVNAQPVTTQQPSAPVAEAAATRDPRVDTMDPTGVRTTPPVTLAGSSQGCPTTYKYTSNKFKPKAAKQANAQQAVLSQREEPLSASMLAGVSGEEQKQMLGEVLFPIIHRCYPELAGKITGMLLEIDNSELLHMLNYRESLKAKVEDAIAVLRAFRAKETLL